MTASLRGGCARCAATASSGTLARFVGADARENGRVKPWLYEQQMLGFNYRMTDIQAALGLSQLGKLDRFLERRRAIARRYDEAFGRLPHVRLPQSAARDRARSGHHLYIAMFDFEACGRHARRS